MTRIEGGCWCNYFEGFLDDFLVNYKCPRAKYNGCYTDPNCEHATYVILVDGVRK